MEADALMALSLTMLEGLAHATVPTAVLFDVVAGLLGPVWAEALEKTKSHGSSRTIKNFTDCEVNYVGEC